jgi:hypothetical protein
VDNKVSIRISAEQFRAVKSLANEQKLEYGEAADELIRIGAAHKLALRKHYEKKRAAANAVNAKPARRA